MELCPAGTTIRTNPKGKEGSIQTDPSTKSLRSSVAWAQDRATGGPQPVRTANNTNRIPRVPDRLHPDEVRAAISQGPAGNQEEVQANGSSIISVGTTTGRGDRHALCNSVSSATSSFTLPQPAVPEDRRSSPPPLIRHELETDPGALATDALSQPWTAFRDYASPPPPPFALIGRCLAKVRNERRRSQR